MSIWYNRGAYELAAFFIAGGTAPVLKAILVTPDYGNVADRDDDFVSQLNASRSSAFGATAEITASAGYVRGFGGSGRKILTTGAAAEVDATDRATLDWDDVSWSGVTTTDQIAGVVLAIERTSDADSPLIAFIDGSPFPTPVGGVSAAPFTIEMPAGGILELLTNP